MKYIDGQGNLKVSEVTRLIRQVAKSVDDTLYHCFDNIEGEHRVKVQEAISELTNLARNIESQEDEFFKI